MHQSMAVYQNKEAGERCLVFLLNLYIAMLPDKAKEAELFYCRPLQMFAESKYWYSLQLRGKHTFNDMVKMMGSAAGIEGHFTNHSLRPTGATKLFERNIPRR